MRTLYLLLFVLLASPVFAQESFLVKGSFTDTAGQPLSSVNVEIRYGSDSARVATGKSGEFRFSGVNAATFTLTATYTGLEPYVHTFTKTGNSPEFRIPAVMLVPADGQLEGIVIKSNKTIVVKEDTVQFDAGAYKVREGAPVEDVIKKLPGVTVDKDGNIEANGKKVARVRVNGKDFFGGDLQTATQNLPADIIDNIQIIDDYGDQANVSGIKSGDPEQIININTKPNRNRGNFGNATLAGGDQGRYAVRAFGNNFRDSRQISVLTSINNTNANLFNFNGGGRGGGARGANFGSEGRSSTGGNGITLSKAFGANYRDKWGERVSVYGSYSFSSRSTITTSSSFSQDVNPENIRTTQRESTSRNHSSNHRFTWNLEYNIDSLNYLKVSPYFSYSRSENESRSLSAITRASYFTLNNGLSAGSSQSPNGGGNLLFNHRFSRRGRNISANISLDYSDNDGDRYANNTYHNIDSTQTPVLIDDTLRIQQIYTASKNTRTAARLSYTEPLNATGSTYIELRYDWNRSATESNRDVNDLQDSAGKFQSFNADQSNHYRYTFITNRAGINLRGHHEKYKYSIGLQSQPSNLTGRSLGKGFSTTYTNINWVPEARFVYNFARNHSLTATLDGSAREPNFFQLQPVADSTNLNNIVVGNPNLRNEFTNTVAIRYRKFDSKTGNSIFVNFSYDRTRDKIVSSRTNNVVGTGRTTTYLNTDGFEGYNGNAAFTKPFSDRKYTAGLSISGSYDNNISFTDNQKNHGSNWNLRPGANFRLDLDNVVDLTLRGEYTLYQTTTRYATRTNTIKAQTLNLGVYGKNYFGDLTVGYDFSKVVNYGFNSSVNSNPAILNVYTEYRFLKGKLLTVRLQGFDLLNNNTGITRTVTENTITDSRTLRLARYVLLSVNYRLARFGGRTRRS